MLSNRCTHILIEILNSREPLKIQHLADMFNLSCRTVRYELDEIDYFFRTTGLPKIVRKPNVGVYFSGGEEAARQAYEALSKGGVSGVVYTPDERCLAILVQRCLQGEPLTIEGMSTLLGVSVSTTLKDIERLRKMMAEYNVGFKRFGLRGDEASIRKAIAGIYMSLLEKSSIFNIVRYISGEKNVVLMPVYFQIFKDIPTDIIRDLINILNKYVSNLPTNDKYLSYAVWLAIQRTRIMQGKYIDDSEAIFLHADDALMVASETGELWQKEGIALPQAEIQFLLENVERLKNDSYTPGSSMNMADLEMTAFCVCRSVQLAMGYPFEYDSILMNGLMEEIPDLIKRAKLGTVAKRHFVKAMQEYVPDLFAILEKACEPIAMLLERPLGEEEISGLAIYFIDYIERKKMRYDRPKVVLAGLEHGPVMTLLRGRLARYFAVDIVDEIALHESGRLSKNNADYVVSFYQRIEDNICSTALSTAEMQAMNTITPLLQMTA